MSSSTESTGSSPRSPLPPIQFRHTDATCSASIRGHHFSDPSEVGTNIVVQVLVSHNHQLYLQSEDGTLISVQDTTTPHHCHAFYFPTNVPALPCLLTAFVSGALQSLHLNMAVVVEDLGPKVEALATEALTDNRMKHFVLVTQVDLTHIQVVDQERGLAWIKS